MLRALLGAILALGIALQPAAAAPVTVRDAFDRSVTVPAPPQRIVAIFASNVEMLAALGLAAHRLQYLMSHCRARLGHMPASQTSH